MIGVRIKEERERLGMTQPQFAEAAGAAKRTLIEWEKGATSPTAVQLSALNTIGVDVMYILTGVRSATAVNARPLSVEEEKHLDNLAHCTKEDQEAIKRMAFIAARPMNQDETQSRTQTKAG